MGRYSPHQGVCSCCKVELTPDNAYKNKKGFNGLDSKCKPCRKSYYYNYRQKPEVKARRSELQRKRWATDPEFREKRIAAMKSWEERNPERRLQYQQDWRSENREKYNGYSRKWRQANLQKDAEKSARRRAKMDTPLTPVEKAWLDLYYDEARRMTDETGIQYEVDHVKPIAKGGEHAPWNMQLLTGYENRVKGAKWHSAAA